jgi:Putative threonine efflux protein
VFGITDLTTFIIGTILIVILPGPNSLYVMSVASRYGIKVGYLSAFGVYTGDLILILLTALGAASLLHAFPWLFLLLKIVGALYLSYLGIKLFKAAYQTWNAVQTPEQLDTKQLSLSELKPFKTALTISILNPKPFFFTYRSLCNSSILHIHIQRLHSPHSRSYCKLSV